MRRKLKWALVLLLLQGAFVGLYVWGEQRSKRAQSQVSPQGAAVLSRAAPRAIDRRLPSLQLRGRDGAFELAPSPGGRLLHVWASWCAPCLRELPGLVRAARARDVELVLIALEEDWAKVDRFLRQLQVDPGLVVLARPAQLKAALGVEHLPVTFWLGGGRLRLRFDGARDWEDASFWASWRRQVQQ